MRQGRWVPPCMTPEPNRKLACAEGLPLNIRINEIEVRVIPISVHRCRRNLPPEIGTSVWQSSARRRHWENATSLGTFSGTGTDGSRWDQDRNYRRDVQTSPSGTVAEVVVCAAPHDG
ncbi:hypothetical protein AVEN_41845-1 [Araneus ventricosus]|uniref:Uncharacterized protein n=1 Tax=Araneus ventricosus TaxID=182803 RepID=A0A4Y2ADZ8_ARAVE|nr:hypothetical protein AVEN_41845-1 [Araneus ventricosus]